MNPIEQRIEDFKSTLIPFEEEYGSAMIIEFFEYWTEPNKSNTKFRQELEKTWKVERRLKTWLKNNINWNGRKSITNEREQRRESVNNLAELSRQILRGHR